MADVIMPQMGESIAEGTVTKWFKNVGDRVERDEPLFEISTDKVDAEIPSPAAGVLKEIRVAPGTTVAINTVVGVIAAEGEGAAAPSLPSAPAPPTPPPVPTPPATPPPAPAPTPETSPVAFQIEGETQAPATAPAAPEKPRAEMTSEELRLTRSSPVVRKIAAEHQLDIRDIPGTGIGGRVTKQDILGHIETRPETPTPAAEAAAPAAPAPDAPALPSAAPAPAPAPPPAVAPPDLAPAPSRAPGAARVEVVPMSPIRRKTAEHMVLSKRTSAHVSTVFEVDMTRIDQLRQKHKASFEERGVRLTYTPFILKAVVDALKAFPVVNASIDGDNVVYHKDVNLAVAVALDWGLIVPVIHHADEKNVLGLARAVNDLAERARAKKLKVEEVQGGTFTVTNPGVFGSLFGTPIINQPQVAILGIGTIEKRPVVRDDAIAIRTMCYFALTFDHRLVDGADADRFMAQVKATLQEFDEAAL
jgi:2-oxoglutarate dehydrogenase E2 component (dihydrolipoamide succinyltransferase)